MYITFNDLLGVLAIFFGVLICLVICALLIVALLELIKVLRKINKIVGDNSASVNKTLVQLPDLVASINQTSMSVKAGADKAGVSLGAIEGLFDADRPDGTSNTVLSILNISESILKLITGFFANKEN